MNDLAAADGRTMRRHRNMERVLVALCELADEGHAVVGSELLSQRSGVSLRSIYRFFPTQEDLVLAALARQRARSEHLYHLPEAGVGPLERRVARYVERRLALHAETRAVATMTRAAAGSMPRLRTALHEQRALLLEMVRAQFAPELATMPQARRRQVELAVHVLCQRESIDALLVEQGLAVDQAANLLGASTLALLAAPRRRDHDASAVPAAS